MKRVFVVSLGGSLIVPDDVDSIFLRKFKKTILSNIKNSKFVIVCGGGSVARKYINSLKAEGLNEKMQNFIGISATRTNARFMSYFFNKNQAYGIPHTLREVEKQLKKEDLVFCGALEYKPRQTSDSTAAEIAAHLKSTFINLTNVPGLYNKNPKEHRDAKFIPTITWAQFHSMANKLGFKPGQHFVLDQTAAKMILKHKTQTYILGQDLRQLENVLHGHAFKGTLVKG